MLFLHLIPPCVPHSTRYQGNLSIQHIGSNLITHPAFFFAPAWYFLVQFHSYLFNYPSVDEHLGCFQFLIITNDAAVDNVVHLPFQTQASLSPD